MLIQSKFSFKLIFKGDIPISSKLLLNKIRLSRNEGDFSDSTESITCLRKKLNLTRLSVEIELEKEIKFDDLTASRIDAAYGSAAIPCVELKNVVDELKKERKNSNATESEVESCVMKNLQLLKPNSLLLENFEIEETQNFSNCSLVVELLIDRHENMFENFFKKSKLRKCNEEEFVQINSFKMFVFESHLAKFVELSDTNFEKWIEEMTNLLNKVSDRQIHCVFKEIY